MMTTSDLKQELDSNEVALKDAIQTSSWLRAFELKLQRDILKDTLIEMLRAELNQYERKAA